MCLPLTVGGTPIHSCNERLSIDPCNERLSTDRVCISSKDLPCYYAVAQSTVKRDGLAFSLIPDANGAKRPGVRANPFRAMLRPMLKVRHSEWLRYWGIGATICVMRSPSI